MNTTETPDRKTAPLPPEFTAALVTALENETDPNRSVADIILEVAAGYETQEPPRLPDPLRTDGRTMDQSTTAQCRQRGCVMYGLWHSSRDNSHRFRTIHTALAAVTVEKVGEGDPWTVWTTPHGGVKTGPLLAPPVPPGDVPHAEYMELRAAVLYALSSAERFNNA